MPSLHPAVRPLLDEADRFTASANAVLEGASPHEPSAVLLYAMAASRIVSAMSFQADDLTGTPVTLSDLVEAGVLPEPSASLRSGYRDLVEASDFLARQLAKGREAPVGPDADLGDAREARATVRSLRDLAFSAIASLREEHPRIHEAREARRRARHETFAGHPAQAASFHIGAARAALLALFEVSETPTPSSRNLSDHWSALQAGGRIRPDLPSFASIVGWLDDLGDQVYKEGVNPSVQTLEQADRCSLRVMEAAARILGEDLLAAEAERTEDDPTPSQP